MDRNAPQVRTAAVDGSQPVWLGSLGQVSGLKYGSTVPGGCDQMTCLLNVPPGQRPAALSVGRRVAIFAGGSQVWDGKLDSPVPGAGGIAITAHGSGTFGTDYAAIYTTWANQNDAVNQAIARGLRWTNSGIPGGVFTSQQQDSGSLYITDLLNLFTEPGGQTWRVGRYNALSVFSLPTAPTRVIVSTTPNPRTVVAEIDSLWVRYKSKDADKAGPATYALTEANLPGVIAVHDRMEDYLDLSNGPVMSAGTAQGIGVNALKRYQRANWAQPFVVRYGQLTTLAGQPVDLATEQAGEVCQVIITDGGYGGEITPGPIAFLTGGLEYDADAGLLTVTPFQSTRQDIATLLSVIANEHPAPAPTKKRRRAGEHPQPLHKARRPRPKKRRGRQPKRRTSQPHPFRGA